jgi:hypothetical protein
VTKGTDGSDPGNGGGGAGVSTSITPGPAYDPLSGGVGAPGYAAIFYMAP